MLTTRGYEPGDTRCDDRGDDRYPGKPVRGWATRWTAPVGAAIRTVRQAWRQAWPHVIVETRWGVACVKRRWWTRLSRRRQHAFVVACGVLLAVGIGLTVHESEPAERGGDVPSPVTMGVPSRIEMAKHPVVVPVRASSIHEITSLSTRQRRGIARRAADKIRPVVEANPERVAVIRLLDLPLSFAALPHPDRHRLELRLPGDAAERYESAIAELLDDMIDAVERAHPKAILTVHGLPVEPEEAGMNLLAVQRTNERYGGVLERLGPFVPARRFVVFGSSLDERDLAKMGMREALRLRHGRPIIFQTNLVWRALVDEDERSGLGYSLEVLLAE